MATIFASERRRRRIMLAIGIVLALIAAAAVIVLSTRPAPPPPVVPTQAVLVAAQAIEGRAVVQPGDVAVREIPTAGVAPNALTDPEQAVGRLTVVPIYQGQQITANLFGAAGDIDFSILQPDETVAPDSPFWRAASVTVTAERAVGGLLHAGQHVDLIANLNLAVGEDSAEGVVGLPGEPNVIVGPSPSVGLLSGTTTKVTFENLLILSTIEDSDSYVFRVDLHQAEELALLQEMGANFNLVLRPDQDTRPIDRPEFGQTLDQVLARYGYDIPALLGVIGVPGVTTEGPSPAPGASPGPGESPAASPGASPEASPAP
jgi:Flp pilus assembly protein CpaB